MNFSTEINFFPFISWDHWSNKKFKPNHFYQTKEWFSVLTNTWDDLKIEILQIGNEYAIPIFYQKKGVLKLVGSPIRGLFTPYGGFLGENQYSQIQQLINGDFCEISLKPGISINSEKWSKNRTIITNIDNDLNKLWKNIKKETRSQIRQSEKNELEVIDCKSDSWVEPYFELVKLTYSRQNLKVPSTKKFYFQISEKLLPYHAKVLLIYFKKTVIAGGIFTLLGDTINFLDGASNREYQNLRPNNLLQWEIIKWASKNGFSSYDMIGANLPGIANFKQSFGGNLVDYQSITWTPTFIGKLSWLFYEKFRNIFKRTKLI